MAKSNESTENEHVDSGSCISSVVFFGQLGCGESNDDARHLVNKNDDANANDDDDRPLLYSLAGPDRLQRDLKRSKKLVDLGHGWGGQVLLLEY